MQCDRPIYLLTYLFTYRFTYLQDSRLDESDRICVNVSGQLFEFRREVLARHPDTLLGNEEKRRMFYDAKRQEYFFDRHRPSFEAIFAYYMYGGRLKRPHHVADDIFLAEIMFHELEDSVITAYKMSEGYPEEETVTTDHRVLQVGPALFLLTNAFTFSRTVHITGSTKHLEIFQ